MPATVLLVASFAAVVASLKCPTGLPCSPPAQECRRTATYCYEQLLESGIVFSGSLLNFPYFSRSCTTELCVSFISSFPVCLRSPLPCNVKFRRRERLKHDEYMDEFDTYYRAGCDESQLCLN
ncbi:hypothetical protein PRIPAC_87144, partial [Pristionchus pacificus]|uniref:Uncharacterized protein n=1 Tax=Pristionchus pacificus TaxID=54126 RepID=A0A2A6B886_PRIPA